MDSENKSYKRIVAFLTTITRPFIKIEVVGLENIPKDSGGIIILNHVSLLDPVLAGIALRNTRQVRALAKESLFSKPIIGKAMENMGHIPVHRGSHKAKDSLATALTKLDAGELVGIYPEGTVPPDLNELGSFKSGAARLALASGVLIVPAVGWGAQKVLPRGKGKLKAIVSALFHKRVHKIVIGEPIGPFPGNPESKEKIDELTGIFKEEILRLLPQVK